MSSYIQSEMLRLLEADAPDWWSIQNIQEVHRKYNSLLPLEMQEQDEEWLDDINKRICRSKIRSTTE